MNFGNSSLSAAYTAAKSILSGVPNLFAQQTRNTIILKRKYPLRLHKKGGRPHRFKKTDYYYELVENTDLKPQPLLDIILTKYVEGVGEKGEKISMKKQKAYNEFLLPGLAVYASPENIKKILIKKDTQEKTYSSLYAPFTISVLSRCCAYIKMSLENPWVLEKWHIRANFRMMGIYITDDSITMPEREIKGPNLDIEGKEFYVTLTINKRESVKVRCRIHHDTFDISKQLLFTPQIWKSPAEPIFPEDKEVLDSLPRPHWENNQTSTQS